MERLDVKINYLKDYIANRKRIIYTLLGFFLTYLIFLATFETIFIDESQFLGLTITIFCFISYLMLLIICLCEYENLDSSLLEYVLNNSDPQVIEKIYSRLKTINKGFYCTIILLIVIAFLTLCLFSLYFLLLFLQILLPFIIIIIIICFMIYGKRNLNKN